MTLDHPPIISTLLWPDEAACVAFAASLAQCPDLADAFIELHGPLGAGKTTFVRHLLRSLGVVGRIKSPTYALIETYTVGAGTVAHLDFYRFQDPREWEDAGLRDVFAQPGLKLVEWPTQAAGLLPVADLSLHIEPLDDTPLAHGRRVTLQSGSACGRALLQAVLATPQRPCSAGMQTHAA